MGSQGSLGGSLDILGWDTLGGPMGPWDRWDLGLKDPGPQGPPIIKLLQNTSSEDTSSIPGPARLPGPGAGCPAAGPVFR